MAISILRFGRLLATGGGSRLSLGEGRGEGGNDAFDVFLPEHWFDGLRTYAGLLLFMTRNVDYGKNFITIDAPADISGLSYDEAREENYFVGRVLENPTNAWVLQIVQVGGTALREEPIETITMGFHTRNADGEPRGNRDNFDVDRGFFLYYLDVNV